jgi:hypothetical protein
LQAQMLGADVVGGEESNERSGMRCGFDSWATSLLTVNQAVDAVDYHAGIARRLNGCDGGTAGGADIIHDYDVSAGTNEAFNFAPGAMGLLRLADKEGVNQRSVGMLERIEGTGRGNIGGDWVGTHGESANSFNIGKITADVVIEHKAGKATASGVKSRSAAIDVVIAARAGGEYEISKAKGFGGKESKQSGAVRISVLG